MQYQSCPSESFLVYLHQKRDNQPTSHECRNTKIKRQL